MEHCPGTHLTECSNRWNKASGRTLRNVPADGTICLNVLYNVFFTIQQVTYPLFRPFADQNGGKLASSQPLWNVIFSKNDSKKAVATLSLSPLSPRMSRLTY